MVAPVGWTAVFESDWPWGFWGWFVLAGGAGGFRECEDEDEVEELLLWE